MAAEKNPWMMVQLLKSDRLNGMGHQECQQGEGPVKRPPENEGSYQ
jgi:hypothetical protein